MQIQISGDNHIALTAELMELVQTVVKERLDRFAERITHVGVQLSDENSSAKGGGDDQRCVIEVRPNGLQPLVVRESAAAMEQAVRAAALKMRNLLTSTFEKRSGN